MTGDLTNGQFVFALGLLFTWSAIADGYLTPWYMVAFAAFYALHFIEVRL